ncbi:PaaI family thioesterase [Rhodococcus ruber]|uniref:PaaI family thioesterase n=1 Tax=Rhodococcus ruber TaxID=1830 RepID=UPI001F264044|nr:PaaI family thioesterase [Rhodococcus ruber]MCF8785077.1 PaaI family thioesterase [Rhodococcus ruber]
MTRTVDVPADLREATAELVAATRALMLAAATTTADADTVRAARVTIAELAETLGSRPRPRVLRPPFDGPSRSRDTGGREPWALFTHNPMGIPLEIYFGADEARARLVANALHEGPPDSVHGGFSAHLLDCMLGTLMQARGSRSLTASLDLRYLRRTPLDEPLDLYSRIVETEGRKTVAEGWIECRGERTVEARGVFVRVET